METWMRIKSGNYRQTVKGNTKPRLQS